MISKNELLKNCKPYAITDLKVSTDDVTEKVVLALEGGVDIIQLRSKSFSDDDLLPIGKKIRQIATRLGKLFIVNDRVDFAIALDADGVHLGQADIPLKTARKWFGSRDKLIGKSTHSLKQAIDAEGEGADYRFLRDRRGYCQDYRRVRLRPK